MELKAGAEIPKLREDTEIRAANIINLDHSVSLISSKNLFLDLLLNFGANWSVANTLELKHSKVEIEGKLTTQIVVSRTSWPKFVAT